jgi:hypothetical protein
LLATACYLVGSFALLVVAIGPRNPYVLRHAQQAMILHVVRFAVVSATILAWSSMGNGREGMAISLSLHVAMLVLIGLPWPVGVDLDLVALLALPLGMPWILAMGGAMVSASGYSLDFHGILSRRWPDFLVDTVPAMGTPEYDRSIGLRGGRPELQQTSSVDELSEVERRIARELRDGRLERMWDASRVAAQERTRAELLKELENRQQTVLVRLDHLNHLLSNGSISMSRYNRFTGELIAYLDALRNVRAQLRSRFDGGTRAFGALPESPDALSSAPDAEAITMAVIDRNGIPVVTYGHFTMDESLISGMVSVMDGLSEEMFGSRASMTQLDDGEVVHFAQGDLCSVFVTFNDEPSPVQITNLREYRDQFEESNSSQLGRGAFDPSRITEIDVPFRFTRRLPSAKTSDQSRDR